MMTTIPSKHDALEEAGRRYVEHSRAALESVPIGEREEPLSDIVDAIAELDGPVAFDELVDRLGAPEAFARELCESSGIAIAQDARQDPVENDPGSSGLGVLEQWRDRGLEIAEWFGRELEPLWWVVRALGVALLLVILGVGRGGGFVLLTVFLVGSSIAIGARARQRYEADISERRGAFLRRGIGLLGVGIVVVWALSALVVGTVRTDYLYDDSPAGGMSFPSGLGTSSGDEITNIYAFDVDGKRIEDVRLYDQDGNPISIGGVGADGTSPAGECCFEPDLVANEDGEVRFRVFDAERIEQFNAFPIRYADQATGEVLDPNAGWPTAPRPLVTAPSIATAATEQEIEAEIERRVQQRLKERAAAKQGAAKKRDR